MAQEAELALNGWVDAGPAEPFLRHLYGRAIRLMDDWLDRLLDRLDRRGILDDTLVIVTSDHGENFGEGGLMAHNFSLDERLTRVPFAAAGPGAEAFEGMLSLAEVPRRIAAAAGIDVHPWREELPAGVAVTQFDAFSSREGPLLDVVADGWGLGDEVRDRLSTPLTAATDGRLKLMRRGDSYELYDLVSDPLELAPLPVESDSVPHLRAALDHAAVHAVPEALPASVDGLPALPDDELEHLEDQMRLLGYL